MPPTLDSPRHVASVYGVLIAREVMFEFTRRYARLFEDLTFDGDSCRRRIRLMWRTPTLAAMKLDPNLPVPEAMILPVTIMRRGQMYSNFQVQGSHSVRILSRASSSRLMFTLVDLEWGRLLRELTGELGAERAAELDERALSLIARIVDGDARRARNATSALVNDLISAIDVRLIDARASLNADQNALLRSFTETIQRVSRRHIIWIEVHGLKPGELIELEYSYETRFAPEYSVRSGELGWWARHYQDWKVWVGQPPSQVVIPISRHTMTRSYHVTLEAPPACFFHRFEFIDQSRKKNRARAFRDAADDVGAHINGLDEAGGDLGHIYVNNMPQIRDLRPAVLAHVMERPPGATANVAWLATFSCLAVAVVLARWGEIYGGSDAATATSIVLALPGLAALWFANVLDHDTRGRLPVAARLGLIVTMYSTAVMLTILLLASLGTDVDGTVKLICFCALVAAPQVAVTGNAWHQRRHFHRCYAAHQRRVMMKYGL